MCCASVRFACGLPSSGLAVARLVTVVRTSCDGPFVFNDRIQWSWMAAAVTPRLATAGGAPTTAPATLMAEVRVALGCDATCRRFIVLSCPTRPTRRAQSSCPTVSSLF
jgi:hypothetical protein